MRKLIDKRNGLSIWLVTEGEKWEQIDGWGALTTREEMERVLSRGTTRFSSKGYDIGRTYYPVDYHREAHIIRFTKDDPEQANEFGIICP